MLLKSNTFVATQSCLLKFKLWCPTLCICPLLTTKLSDIVCVQDDIKKQGAPDPDGTQPMYAPTPALLPATPPSLFVCRYVGGGNSGGGVSANVIDESLLADKIKAQGGRTIEEHERDEAEKKKPQPFAGAGNSIRGGTVQAAPSSTAPAEKKFTIHLWRNGIRCSCSFLAHVHSSIVTYLQPRRWSSLSSLRPAR